MEYAWLPWARHLSQIEASYENVCVCVCVCMYVCVCAYVPKLLKFLLNFIITG